MLPQGYPNYKTVHRRFQNWCRNEVLRDVLMDLANTLHEQGDLDESEAFIDGMFSAAKGGGADIGHSKRGKGVRVMGIWTFANSTFLHKFKVCDDSLLAVHPAIVAFSIAHKMVL